MLVGNGYYIVETKEEFISRWSPNGNRFNYNAMPYGFNPELASFPLALRFQDSFDPHFCGCYTIVPMAEAYDNILKACEEEIAHLMASREKLKNLAKEG